MLMEKWKAKLQNRKGFTLVEMLIVVAIIAILIAVSIPMISGALEKARDATDQANERAAKAEITLVYMGAANHPTNTTYVAGSATGDLYYNATTGKLVGSFASAGDGYGQCTGGTNCYTPAGATAASEHAGDVIKVSMANDTVTMEWVDS